MSKFNKAFLIVSLGLSCFANATSVDPFTNLLKEVNNKTIFKQATNSRHCPKYITPVNSSEYAEAGDQSIYLATADTVRAERSGDFTFDGNRINYRAGLEENKNNAYGRKLNFPLGISYTVCHQMVKNGVLTSEYSAKIASVVMVGTSNYVVKYDANQDTITYRFAGNGVEDVNCIFTKTNL